MNRFCGQVATKFCKSNISISISSNNNFGCVSDILPMSHNKILSVSRAAPGSSYAVSFRPFSAKKLLQLKHGQSPRLKERNSQMSHKLFIRWKSFGGYSNFGHHRDTEKIPLVSKLFVLLPTCGLFALFVNWPKVIHFVIDTMKEHGYNLPEPVLTIVESADSENPGTRLSSGVKKETAPKS